MIWIILATLATAGFLIHTVVNAIALRESIKCNRAAAKGWDVLTEKNQFDLTVMSALSLEEHQRVYRARQTGEFYE